MTRKVPYRVLERQYSFDEFGQHSEDNGSETGFTMITSTTLAKKVRIFLAIPNDCK